MNSRALNFISFVVAAIIILLQGCAQVGSPSGGAKDLTSPEVVSFSPENYTTNFTNDEIVIEFDEYIQFKDIYTELIISPPLIKRPEISIRKKSVRVKIMEELKTDATYIFNFGAGISDYTEGNPAKNLVYVFSTGTEIDSLNVSGKVYDAYTGEAMSTTKVMLYEQDLDSLPYLEKPYYFSQTDENGVFNINHVKEGFFKIIALQDENSNYLFDNGEGIAFLDYMVTSSVADSTSISYDLFLSTEKDTLQFISDYSRDSTGFVRMAMNIDPDSLSFELLNSNSKFYYEKDLENDSVYFWLTGTPSNSDLNLVVKDRTQSLDTLSIMHFDLKYNKKVVVRKKGHSNIKSTDKIELISSDYLKEINSEKIILTLDSIPEIVEVALDSSSKRGLNIDCRFKSGSVYQLTLFPGAVTNLQNETNDTLVFNYEIYQEEYFGEIILEVNNVEESGVAILQLLNEDHELLKELTNIKEQKILFNTLLPGNYNIRIIIDKNENGIWDSGNYLDGKQAEKIIHYPNPINVRSNWTIEHEWELGIK